MKNLKSDHDILDILSAISQKMEDKRIVHYFVVFKTSESIMDAIAYLKNLIDVYGLEDLFCEEMILLECEWKRLNLMTTKYS